MILILNIMAAMQLFAPLFPIVNKNKVLSYHFEIIYVMRPFINKIILTSFTTTTNVS
jgi:hypothetical protein